MNIYLLTRKDKYDYDDYDSFVVVAPSIQVAKTIHPAYTPQSPLYAVVEEYGSWTTEENIDCEYLGVAASNLNKIQVICASFNAG